MVFNVLTGLVSAVPSDLLILTEIGFMIIIAAFFAFLIRLFKQPIIPAYIIAGILLGPLVFGVIENQHLIDSLSHIGVAFLIFTAGLEIKFKKLKEVGKASSIGGVLQIVILFGIAFFVSMLLGFSGIELTYIGLVVAFSSTMIVVKLLSDRRELNSLHGRLVIGILLIQDIAAILALTILSSDLTVNGILFMILKACIFAIAAFILTKAINPIFKSAAKNHELFLMVSISLLFLFAIASSLLLNSLVIGAFFAGVILANSDFKTEIEGRIAPLRDFFAVIFFVALGMQLRLISSNFVILLAILLLLVVILKPLVIMFLIRLFGYKKSTSFFTGNALAQTSEFSLIFVTLGLVLGHIGEGLFSTLVLLTIITMSLTTYCISYERELGKHFDWPLNILKRMKSKKEELEYNGKKEKKAIIFGCHRMGSLFLKEFENEKKEVLVIDYNPEIIRSLIKKKIPCIYGDFMNEEIFERLNFKNTEIVVSTIPDFEDNLHLIRKIKKANKKALVFIVASRISEAKQLYKAGADYVILPEVIGGQKGFELIRKIKRKGVNMKELKKNHIKYLDSIHHILY